MERIEECISFLLGKAYQQVQQAAKGRLAPHGVTPVQYALLRVIWERDGQTGAELGERLQLDSATITGLLTGWSGRSWSSGGPIRAIGG
jgi:MarR family transcriptional regulator, organic hydroperoxide resistance regulator